MTSIYRNKQILCVFNNVLNKTSFRSLNELERKFSTTCAKKQILTSKLPTFTVPDTTLPDYLIDRFQKYEGRVALESFETGHKYTYDELPVRIKALAANLRNKFGLQDGDTVTVVLPNISEYAIIVLGITKANYVCSTCNPCYKQEEIKKQLINSNSKLVITVEEGYETINKANQALDKPLPIIVIRNNSTKVPTGAFDFEDLLNPNTNLDVLQTLNKLDPNSIALRMYSSGTTGLPKGVNLTHRNVVANIMQQELSRAYMDPELGPYYPYEVPGILPYFHIFGLSVILTGRLCVGSRVMSLREFSGKNFIEIFKKHKPQCLYLVPPLVLLMTCNPLLTKEDFSNLTTIFVGAAPLGESDTMQLRKKLNPSVRIIQGYGLTETAPVALCYNPYIKNYNSGSIGELVSNTEGRFVDFNTGKDVAQGEEGELWIRGPQVMKGYHNNEEATKECITPDGWFKTGDIAKLADDGQVYITDRMKELIKVKGFQVAPAELESILRAHPAVIDAAVIGIEHKFYGEVPKAFVILGEGNQATEKEIQDFVANQTADYKHLSGGIQFVSNIPKSQAGKILRRELKQEYASASA